MPVLARVFAAIGLQTQLRGSDLIGGRGAVLTAAILLSSAPAPAAAQEVFLGSADQWRDLAANPGQWTFVRDNVDGLYVNFIMMKRLQEGLLEKTVGMLRTHRVFLESDQRLPRPGDDTSGASAGDDQAFILKLHGSGLRIPYTSLNYGWSLDRAANLVQFDKLPGAPRKNLVQVGPWNLGGAIDGGAEGNGRRNAAYREWIDAADGVSTDGPMGLWKSNSGHMREGSVSVVRFAHRGGKMAAIMLGPYGAKNPDYEPGQFLSVSQDAVRLHEDSAAVPDIWTVFEYATSIKAVPEQENGRAAPTTTGVAFWLLHHLRDPDREMSLSASPNGWHPAGGSGGRAFAIMLSNRSSWTDFAPRVRLVAAGHNSRVRAFVDGQNVSRAIRDGVPFSGALRLWPGEQRTIRIVTKERERKQGKNGYRLELFPGLQSRTPEQVLPLPPDEHKWR